MNFREFDYCMRRKCKDCERKFECEEIRVNKTIHYVWMGKGEKSELIRNCIASWKKHLPDYAIKEWNEDNFNLDYNKFTRQSYDAKKYAFTSDVVRLYALYTEGGIYLDTDVEVFKNLDEFLTEPAFTGFESIGYPVCATMGAEKGNPLIKEMLDYYNDKEFKVEEDWTKYTTNTVIMSDILEKHGIDRHKNQIQRIENITVYPQEYFNDKGGFTVHHMTGSWRIMQKKIILWQSYFCSIGGVETFVFNWCIRLRNYFDILVLYQDGDYKQIARTKPYARCEKINREKTYEADIAIRNSVWVAPMPINIQAPRIIEMKHANYKYLKDTGKLDKQYVMDERVTEHLACGEFVAKMYEEVTGKKIPFIPNILAPKKKTEKIYRFLSTSRIYDEDKGWNEILRFCEMLKEAKIKFEFTIFSKLPSGIQLNDVPFKEIHIYEPQLDILDYVADTAIDYVVLFTKSEGRPYSIAEALQYGKPCIVSDVGGCTELVKDGENGYVVPLDMNFDINKIKKIPKFKPTKDDEVLDQWCDLLGGAEYVEKPLMKYPKVKIQAISDYDDTQLNKHIAQGTVYEVDEDRADEIVRADFAKYYKGEE